MLHRNKSPFKIPPATLAWCFVSSVLLFFFRQHACPTTVEYKLSDHLLMPTETHTQSFQVARHVLDYRGIVKDVYIPHKLSLCPQHACWLRLYTTVNCRTLYSEYAELLRTHVAVFPPPNEIEQRYQHDFSLNGYTTVTSFYMSQAEWAPDAKVQMWEADFMQDMVNRAKARPAKFGIYGGAVQHVYAALDCHPVEGQHGAVFGTEEPWMEAVLLAHGATQLTTIEFRKTASKYPRLVVMQPMEWVKRWQEKKLPEVDFAVSYSSWEHDGLGRYGDPIDPWGDIKAMQRASCYVKPGGLMYFGAPTSAFDQLQYNAHRIYGAARFPLLTANWEVLGVYETGRLPGVCGTSTCDGILFHWANKAPIGTYTFQPMVVLKNRRIDPCRTDSD